MEHRLGGKKRDGSGVDEVGGKARQTSFSEHICGCRPVLAQGRRKRRGR